MLVAVGTTHNILMNKDKKCKGVGITVDVALDHQIDRGISVWHLELGGVISVVKIGIFGQKP